MTADLTVSVVAWLAPVPWRTVNVPSRELTPEDVELIEFARAIVDANTDGEDGVHTMGAAARGVDGTMYGGSTSTTSPRTVRRARGPGSRTRVRARELSAIVAVGNCG